jgi:uncharacterized protein (DUF1778 family)
MKKKAKSLRSRGRPRTGETPKQYFRMPKAEYALVKQAAKLKKAKNTSEFVRDVLLRVSNRILKKNSDILEEKNGGCGS